MSGKRDMQELAKKAKAHGWSVEIAPGKGSHLKFRGPLGQLVFGPQTPSDPRSVYNVRAKLRRAGLAI